MDSDTTPLLSPIPVFLLSALISQCRRSMNHSRIGELTTLLSSRFPTQLSVPVPKLVITDVLLRGGF